MPSLSDGAALGRIVERTAGLSPGSPALWGVLSAHEMVLHLSEAMAGASQGLRLERRPTRLGGTIGRLIALHSGLRWPRNVATVPELDPRGRPKPDVSLFARDCDALRCELRRFAGLNADCLSPEHPFFGSMTREEWMIWAWRHADHHLRQFGC